MWDLIRCEWLKLRRCPILLVGIAAMSLCPAVQYGSQQMVAPEFQTPDYGFSQLFASVIWGNTQIFLPISLVMTGGWMIDRERGNDTEKNLLTLPVSYPRLLMGKLAAAGMLALLFGLCSAVSTLFTGILTGLPGVSPEMILGKTGQLTAAALATWVACMPLILLFGQLPRAYLGGSILAFLMGYCILFFKDGFLLSAYPFSAALVLSGFSMAEFNGAKEDPYFWLALGSLAAVGMVTGGILLLSADRGRTDSFRKRKRGGKRGRRRSGQK